MIFQGQSDNYCSNAWIWNDDNPYSNCYASQNTNPTQNDKKRHCPVALNNFSNEDIQKGGLRRGFCKVELVSNTNTFESKHLSLHTSCISGPEHPKLMLGSSGVDWSEHKFTPGYMKPDIWIRLFYSGKVAVTFAAGRRWDICDTILLLMQCRIDFFYISSSYQSIAILRRGSFAPKEPAWAQPLLPCKQNWRDARNGAH